MQLLPRDSFRQIGPVQKRVGKRRLEQPGTNRFVQLEPFLNYSKEFLMSDIQTKLGVQTTDFDVDSVTLPMKIAMKAKPQVKRLSGSIQQK